MFKYNDKVKVVKGFYEGCEGRVIKIIDNIDIPIISSFISSYDYEIEIDNKRIVSVYENEIQKSE